MKRNQIIGAVVAIIIIGGGAFYAGTVYGKSNSGARGNFAAGQFPGGAAGFTNRSGGTRGGTAGFTAGEIVSSSNGSISIKMQNGSSTEIVLVGANTQILKSATGAVNDLTVGSNVTVTGTPNSDGSLSAASIQIRPTGVNQGFGSRGVQTAQTQ